MSRMTGFVQDTQTNIVTLLQFADAWSALQQENTAMNYFGIVDQPTLDAIFGANVVSIAQYQAALTAMQAVVDNIHVPATASKLYRLKK